jgi:hypothetical protein
MACILCVVWCISRSAPCRCLILCIVWCISRSASCMCLKCIIPRDAHMSSWTWACNIHLHVPFPDQELDLMGLGHSFLPSSSRCVSSVRGHSRNKPERKQCYKSTYRRRAGGAMEHTSGFGAACGWSGCPLVLACSAKPRCLPGAKISSYIEDVEEVYPRPGLVLCLLMPLLHLLDAAIHEKEHEDATAESSIDGGRRESGSTTRPPAAVHDHPR